MPADSREPLIISAVRTPVGKYGRSLKDIPAPQLGALVIQETVKRAGLRVGDVEEVILGNVLQAGVGQAPARQAALLAGIPVEVGALTVNKVCASGLKAVALAADAIRAGSEDLVVAGGMENMSRAPYLLTDARWGYRHGHARTVDAMIHDGLWDPFNDFHMGVTGERIAERFHISREEQDQWALQSHVRALKATESGAFRQEIAPVEVHEDGGQRLFDRDEGIRPDTSLEKLAALPPVFQEGGMVTAGNASQLSDGAAAVVVASRERAEQLGLKPMVRIVETVAGGVRPENVMEAPIPTVQKLFRKTGLGVKDVDFFEHNEAYASATVAVARALEIPVDRLNVRGGAVALGHPLGCSGARILTTLLHVLKDHNARRGLATLCLGGGNAMAMLVERA